MQFKTEQHIISGVVAVTGVIIIGIISNPNYGILGNIALVIGIFCVGFGGVLEGSIKE